jgi:hypothetical protein
MQARRPDRSASLRALAHAGSTRTMVRMGLYSDPHGAIALDLKIWPQVPLDRRPSVPGKLPVRPTEGRAPQERRGIIARSASGPRRGVRRLEHNVAGRVDLCTNVLRLSTPEKKRDRRRLGCHRRNDGGRHVLPALVGMAAGFAPTDGQDRVQEQDALAGPRFSNARP